MHADLGLSVAKSFSAVSWCFSADLNLAWSLPPLHTRGTSAQAETYCMRWQFGKCSRFIKDKTINNTFFAEERKDQDIVAHASADQWLTPLIEAPSQAIGSNPISSETTS